MQLKKHENNNNALKHRDREMQKVMMVNIKNILCYGLDLLIFFEFKYIK